jgi:hypothetical protein
MGFGQISVCRGCLNLGQSSSDLNANTRCQNNYAWLSVFVLSHNHAAIMIAIDDPLIVICTLSARRTDRRKQTYWPDRLQYSYSDLSLGTRWITNNLDCDPSIHRRRQIVELIQ